MTSTTNTLEQTHPVLIGDFKLSFIVQVRYCSGEPGGWMWAAIAEDDMTDWFRGGRLWATDTAALNAAIAHLTEIFN